MTWFQANKLSLNVRKSNYILFGRKHIPTTSILNIKIDQNVLERVTCTKFLGVQIDSHLTWDSQIKYLSIKIARGVGILSRCKYIMPRDVLLCLYNSLIYPYINYCCIIWGNACKTVIRPIQMLQNRAIRLISLKPHRSTASPLFKNLCLLKVHEVAIFQSILFMRQFILGQLPRCMMHYFSYRQPQLTCTRSRDIFAIPTSRTNLFQSSIAIAGPKLWNSLPSNLQQTNSILLFKSLLKMTLLETY